METRIMVQNNRNTILAREDGEGLYNSDYYNRCNEIAKVAIETLPLSNGMKYFLGATRIFFILQEQSVSFHAMRENWNGWNDHEVYSLPSWEKIGRVIQPNPSAGTHRATWVPE